MASSSGSLPDLRSPRPERLRHLAGALALAVAVAASAAEIPAIKQHLATVKGFDRADEEYFSALLTGVIRHAPALEEALQPHLDRKFAQLSPIERAILLIAAFELANRPEVPYRVVINEAVELAKSYGGTDGFKFVNGVLDKMAAVARPAEARTR